MRLALATLVFAKENGRWLMSAGQNGDSVNEAQPFDHVERMPGNYHKPLTIHRKNAR